MKQVLIDQFGDFGLNDIFAMVFAMLAASGIVYVLGYARRKENRGEMTTDIVLAALICAVVSVVKGSLPLAVAFAGVMIAARLFIRPPKRRSDNQIFSLVAVIIGLICGARAVMIAIVAAIPLFILLHLARERKRS